MFNLDLCQRTERLEQIRREHNNYWRNWDKPFPQYQYSNYKSYDSNDVQFLLDEIDQLKRRPRLVTV